MTWNLFIDDIREPPDLDRLHLNWGSEIDWTVARSLREVQDLVRARGMAIRVSFDLAGMSCPHRYGHCQVDGRRGVGR